MLGGVAVAADRAGGHQRFERAEIVDTAAVRPQSAPPLLDLSRPARNFPAPYRSPPCET